MKQKFSPAILLLLLLYLSPCFPLQVLLFDPPTHPFPVSPPLSPVSPPSLYLLFLLLMCTCFFTFCLSSSCCFFSTLCICFFTFRFSSSCSYFSLLLRSPPLPFPPSSHSFCLVSRPFPPFREGMKSKISSCCIHDQVMIMYYHQPSCAARWWQ